MAEHRGAENSGLLPCPFCGSRAAFGQVEGDPEGENYGGHFITCNGCIATTDLRFSDKEDARPLLAEAWNRRIGIAANGETAQSREGE